MELGHGHGPKWVTATDENGVDFHALLDEGSSHEANGETYFDVWVFTNKASGFQDTVGLVNLKKLKHLGGGKYGA